MKNRGKERIGMEDTLMSATLKLSEGNPGAATVLVKSLQEGPKIDPDDFAGPFGVMLGLDTMGIYGPRIWMLFKDVCGQDMTKMVACLRGVQLGLMNEAKLDHAIDHRGEGLDVDTIMIDVCKTLPRFNKPAISIG